MRYSKLLQQLTLAGLILLLAASAQAAGYIKFEGVAGGSSERQRKGWSEIISFSQVIKAGGSEVSGAARRRGGVKFEALNIVRQLDKASPKLAEAITEGKIFPSMTLELTTNTEGADHTYYKIQLTNARVTSYQVGGSANDVPTEEIQVSFEGVTVTYTEVDRNGKGGSSVEFSWKVEKGEK